MIKVIVKSNNIVIKGHANYADYDKDIVCAAVSATVITSINGILNIDNNAIKYIEKDGYIEIDILKNDIIVNKLIDNMINLLKELSDKYKKNIIVKEE